MSRGRDRKGRKQRGAAARRPSHSRITTDDHQVVVAERGKGRRDKPRRGG